jgi:hypothetical protein
MNISKQAKVLFLVLVLSVMAFLPIAPASTAWSMLPTYLNGENVIVNNWNYTNGRFQTRSGFVVTTLHDVGSFSSLKILGYSGSSNTPAGTVPWFPIQQSGNTLVVMLMNVTNESIPWNLATVFYNPLRPVNTNTGLDTNFTRIPYRGQNFTILNYLYQYLNYTSPFSTSNTFYVRFNFTPQSSNPSQLGFGDFVLLANRSLASRQFASYWYPNALRTFLLSDVIGQNAYALSALGLFGGQVSNTPVYSPNANTVFLGKTDGTGFEEFMSINAQGFLTLSGREVYSEGMGVNSTTLFNSTPAANAGIGLNPNGCIRQLYIGCPPASTNYNSSQFYVNVSNTPTSYMVLPSFSTNYTLDTPFTNPNASINATYGEIYPFQIYVDNVSWTYQYLTASWPGNLGHTTAINFGSGVDYLKFTTTHWNESGPTCNNVEFVAYNATTNTNYGVIPFYVLNCSVYSPTATYLLYNTTPLVNGYTSFYMYYGSFDNAQDPSLSNSVVLNDWQLADGKSWTIYPTKPVLVTSSGPIINGGWINVSNPSAFRFIQHISFGKDELPITSYFIQALQEDCHLINNCAQELQDKFNTQWLFRFNSTEQDAISVFSVGQLRIGALGGDYYFNISNTTNSFQFPLTTCFSPCSILDENITANMVYPTVADLLTTTNYHQFPPSQTPLNQSIGLPKTPVNPLNVTGTNSSSRNYSLHTSTINFNSNTIALTTLAPGVQLPTYLVYILAIIIVIIGASLFAIPDIGHFPIVIVLIGLWFSAFTNINIAVIAIIATSIFVLEEFIDRRRKR